MYNAVKLDDIKTLVDFMTDFRQRYEKQWYFKLSFGPLVIDLIQQCITIYLKHLWRLANPETLMDLNLLRGICKLILAWNLRIWKLWYWPTGYILKWELAVRIDSIDDFSSRLVWPQVSQSVSNCSFGVAMLDWFFHIAGRVSMTMSFWKYKLSSLIKQC